MSFFLANYLSKQDEDIKPLHVGFGFYGEEIQKRLGKLKKIELDINTDAAIKLESSIIEKTSSKIIPSLEDNASIAIPKSDNKNKTDKNDELQNKFLDNQKFKSEYYVNPFFAFLAWTIDAILGFCFLIISLCINYVFVPKGIFVVSPTVQKYLNYVTLDVSVFHTFLFSLQVWFLMAFLVFLFQYTILGFEGSTLGRWIFGIAIQNNKNKGLKVSEKTKVCAALSESLLLGGILSFIFVVISPSRVPIFFWMRYSSKK
ncbi:RDD family protein [Silvanigrella sp.]|jgi:hypothetical protein|uniref:RDD family protein n=1 Tax=Silvanigrella sp. TaxID=2024976 RepID=UPI0037C86CAC